MGILCAVMRDICETLEHVIETHSQYYLLANALLPRALISNAYVVQLHIYDLSTDLTALVGSIHYMLHPSGSNLVS